MAIQNPSRVRLAAMTSGAVMLGALSVVVGPLMVPILATCLAVAAVSWRLNWTARALFVLVLVASLSGVGFRLAGLYVIPERAVLPGLLGIVLVTLLFRPREGLYRRVPPAYLGLALLFIANTVGTLLNGADIAAGLRGTAVIVLASVPLLLVPLIISDRRALRQGLWIWYALGAVEGWVGIGAVVFHALIPTAVAGLQLDGLTGAYAPYGLMWEGNVFGSFEGAVFVASLATLTSPALSRRERLLTAVVSGTCAVAVLLSLSRGAWLGVVAGAIVVITLCRWTLWRKLAVVWTLVLVSISSVGLSSSTGTTSPFLIRLGSLSNMLQGGADATTIDRSVAYRVALETWAGHALVGAGPGAIGHTYSTPTASGQPLYVSNLELRTLTDSGLLGLAGVALIWCGVMFALVLRLRSAPRHSAQAWQLLALIGASTSLLVDFQASDASWLAYPWYVLGLGVAACAVPSGETSTVGRGSIEASARDLATRGHH